MDSIFTNHSYNFTIYIRLIYWLTVLLGITVSLNICCIQSDWIDIKLAFIYTWKLYYPRQKKTGPLPGDSTIFQSSLSTPPPPNKTRVIFRPTLGAREFSSAVSGFQTPIFNVDLHLRTLSKFPGYGEVTHPLAQLELEVQHRCVIFPTQSLAEKSHCEDQKNT